MKLEGIPYVTSLLKDLNLNDSNPRFFSLGNLHIGETIDAKILEFLGERLLLEYKGEKFYAKTNMDVKDQNTIKLLFEGAKDGEVRFRAIPNQNEGSSLNKLEVALNEMGVKATDKNVLIAQNLVHQKLPVTKENITFLEKMTPHGVNETSREEFEMIEHIKVATKLFANELPMTKNLVSTIVLSSKENHIVDNLKVLEDIFADKKVMAENKLVNVDTSDSSADSSATTSNPKNQHNININPSNMEFNGEIESSTREGFTGSDNIPIGIEEVQRKITNLLKDFILLDPKGDTLQSLQNVVKNPTLLKMFDILESITVLETLEKDIVENPLNDSTQVETETEKVKESISNMIRGLSKELLVNTERTNNLDLKDTYLNIPFKIDEQWYPASLHIKREGERDEKINLDTKVFVSVSVETKNIDRVKVNLELMKGNINCTILVENQLGYDTFSRSKDELTSSLKENFNKVDVKVIKTQTSVEPFTDINDDKFQGIGRIDFRV